MEYYVTILKGVSLEYVRAQGNIAKIILSEISFQA